MREQCDRINRFAVSLRVQRDVAAEVAFRLLGHAKVSLTISVLGSGRSTRSRLTMTRTGRPGLLGQRGLDVEIAPRHLLAHLTQSVLQAVACLLKRSENPGHMLEE